MTNPIPTSTLRRQIAALTARQSSETLLHSWILACKARLDTTTADEARPFTISMDAIEAELTGRGWTPEQFSALFIATTGA